MSYGLEQSHQTWWNHSLKDKNLGDEIPLLNGKLLPSTFLSSPLSFGFLFCSLMEANLKFTCVGDC